MKSSTKYEGAFRVLGLVCLLAAGPHLTACAKAPEASQASEPAPAEAEEKATEGEGAAKSEAQAADDAPRQKASPGAPQPAAPPPAAERPRSVTGPEETRGGNALKEKQPLPLDIEDASDALSNTFSDLERALQLSVPDCTTAKQLRDRVCELSEHICRLADETDTRASQELCGDGRGRCAEAKRRYSATCAD